MFEVDPRSGDLRKNALKLTGQPFQVLAILLERPGQLVAAKSCSSTLWSGDNFVISTIA